MAILFQENESLIYCYNGETLRIEPWGANSLRVRAVPLGKIIDTEYALLLPIEQKAEILVQQTHATITNGKITARIELDADKNGIISFCNQKGEILLKEYGRQGALALNSRKFKPVIGGDYQLTVNFASSPEEKIYGMGQYQQEFLDIKNCTLELAHRNSQASIPFALSSLGYGFFWHNPAVGEVSFGKNMTKWQAQSTRQMDYWITAGDTPKEIEEAYADVTGKVPMMPEYGLGFWQCKLRYWNQEQLLAVAREHKRRNIPIDVIVCDFFHWPKLGDFRFDKEFFHNPKVMVEELKSLGIELMVSIWPQIGLESENFEEMREKGLLVKVERGIDVCMRFGGDSIFFDATKQEARQYVWDKCKQNYYDDGIKLFWLDEAEPEFGVYDYENYRYELGTTLQVGNIYPQQYAKAFYDGMVSEGHKEIVNLVRCAWAGSQKYGALVWSGDIHSNYEALRKQICAGINMGIAGIPWWTTDIGGFAGGDPDDDNFRELLIRWFQYGTFCPVMRLHGDRMPSTKLYRADGSSNLFTGGDNEIWSYGEENYQIMKHYIELREAMRPYIREMMKEAHEKGTPVIRAMFYEFPEHEVCWQLKDQYMFGPDFLVAPIVNQGDREREVYLPGCEKWISIHDGKTYEGDQVISVEAPLEIIPVFYRGNKVPDFLK